ncbi:MAG: hypothetical protein Q8891_03965 [Bacteroidota bacterium]|nr:hypothetical protein [Bacteroidota bacterium]
MKERDFDMTNFEEVLKNQADQFKMIPSRRVWHGIYNDLHPGSKWPSIAMTLVFLFTLFGIGHLNNTEKRSVGVNSTFGENATVSSNDNNIISLNTNSSSANQVGQSLSISQQDADFSGEKVKRNSISVSGNEIISETQEEKAVSSTASHKGARIVNLYPDGIHSKKSGIQKNENLVTGNSTIKKSANNDIFENTSIHNFGNENNLVTDNDLGIHSSIDNFEFLESDFLKNNGLTFDINDEYFNNLREIFSLNNEDKISPIHSIKNATIEPSLQIDNITENKENQSDLKNTVLATKKRNSKANWLYFVTPTISTVSFIGKGFQPSVDPNPSPIIVQTNQNKNGMIYNANMGFEIGTQIAYNFTNEWQFIIGANLSYSGYNVISNQVHPTFATLLLKDESTGLPYSRSYITHYGNGQGQNQISLSNYSLQFSLPVGLQYSLFENRIIKINLASTIGPSLILKSNAFIISSDERYYINDPDLLRKVNVSGNFGTFITFKSNKLNWHIGPSIRYQLLSTYQKNYPIKEHLIDYGIRIGISK